ncbi:MAG: ribonuclease H-like domain-containing protein [bacterium]
MPASWSGQTTLLRDFEPESIAFFDIETTGLGAGAMSFCLGLGHWSGDQICVEQWVLANDRDERATIEALAARLRDFECLVTFNGASFDVPRVNERAVHHGLESPFLGKVHVDLLQVARRLLPRGSMSLADLERQMLGLRRHDDIPGSEAPLRWQTYSRTGIVSGLLPLFDHNVQDIVSLAGLNAAFRQILQPECQPSAEPQKSPSPVPQPQGAQESELQQRLRQTYRLRRERNSKNNPPAAPAVRPTNPAPVLGPRLTELRQEAAHLLKEGRDDEALPFLHEMVALSPANPYPLNELARFYAANGQPELAEIFRMRLKGLGFNL